MRMLASGFAVSTHLALSCSAAVLGLAAPTAALAQNEDEAQPAAPADEYAEGNEIVVTATKREQTLQDVPVAVSVTTAETIERAQIRDIKDLTSLVPSLRVVEHQSSAQTDFKIRGFGNGANNVGIEPSVGVFIDGVYRSRSAAQIADFPDIERVEVLRGPQSTLFGKNASVGVISIVTQKPKFEFGGNVEASYGNYNALVLKGMVTGPLSSHVAASIAAGYNRRDGYIHDLGTGHDTNERNRWFVRGQLLYQGDNGLSVRLIGDYGKIDENCCAVINVRPAFPTTVIQGLGGNVNSFLNPFADVVYNNFDSTNKIENYGFSGQIDYDVGPLKITSITAWRKSNALTTQDSDFSSADILGRHDENQRITTFTQELRLSANFVDRLNVLLGAYYFNEKIRQDNVLQWGSQARPYFDALVRGLTNNVGSVYTTSGGATALEPTLGFLDSGNPFEYNGLFFAAGQGLTEHYNLKNEAISIFGQVDFKVTDRLTLTGGISYTHDAKHFTTNNVSTDVFSTIDINNPAYAPLRVALLEGLFGYSPANAIAAQATPALVAANNPLTQLRALQIFPPFLNVPNAVEPGRTSDGNVSYTARLAYQATDHINAYLSFATGFKASSINLSRDARPSTGDFTTIETNPAYANLRYTNLIPGSRFAGPEKSTVYEAGLKANWPDVTVNIAVFKQIVRGFQANDFTGLGFRLANAGKQSTFGIEFEGTVRPVKELTLGAAITYLDPKYDSYVLSPFGDGSGTRPAGIPSFAFTVSGEWNHELANSDHLILHADFHHESKVRILEGLPGNITTNPLNGAVLPAPGGFAAGLAAADAFTRQVDELNASLTYAFHNGLELTLWGRNLTNNRFFHTIFDSPAQIGSVSAYPNQPRTWGGAIRYRW